MAKYKVGVSEQDNTSSQSEQDDYTRNLQRMREEERRHIQKDPIAHAAGSILDRTDTFIYAAVGFCFLLGALIALLYTFWDFGSAVFGHLSTLGPPALANAINNFVSGLLLVLIITEVLGTVIHYLKTHETSLRPFLFIGIVSATRSILSIGARLSVESATVKPDVFTHAMIELGVSARLAASTRMACGVW